MAKECYLYFLFPYLYRFKFGKLFQNNKFPLDAHSSPIFPYRERFLGERAAAIWAAMKAKTKISMGLKPICKPYAHPYFKAIFMCTIPVEGVHWNKSNINLNNAERPGMHCVREKEKSLHIFCWQFR